MDEQEQLTEMIGEMFDSYMEDGFDFDSDMTFTEVFRQIFFDAVNMTIQVLDTMDEKQEEDEDAA